MSVLSQQQVDHFHEFGFVLIPDFYDVQRQIEPIQRAIHELISLVAKSNDLPVQQQPFTPELFDSGYQRLIAHDRTLGGTLYDAVKMIPAFMRLLATSEHEEILRQLRSTDLPGIAAGGYGIRIDNPHEERFRAPWHQDYPGQFRSLDGVVFWSPLAEMTSEMGPVEICSRSHHDGLVRIHTTDPRNPDKTGAYALILEDEEDRISRYEHVAPLTKPGDLLLMDFLTIHRSGSNISSRSRWSMQMRYFNFLEPTGVRIKWSGAYAENADLQSIHPELYIG